MKILILKNGDVSAEVDSLSMGNEPPHSYISEIFALRSLGNIYVVGHSSIQGESSYGGIDATTILRGQSVFSELCFQFKIWQYLNLVRPDLVIVLHPWELLIAPYWWCRLRKKQFLPCIPRPPNPENIRFFRKVLNTVMIRPILRCCPKIMARSTIVKNALIKWCIPQKRILVYLPPYSQDFFDCDHLLPIRPDEFNIVFLGRLVELKGVFDLIEILGTVLKNAPSVHLYIVGAGPERKTMERRVADLGIAKSITFLGEIPQKQVFGYLAPADVAVLPSHQEGLGKTALEALLSGVPVLGTAGTGFGEFVKDGYNGFLIPKGDVDGYAELLTKLISDPSRLATLKKNALQTRDTIMNNTTTFETAIADFVSKASDAHEDERFT